MPHLIIDQPNTAVVGGTYESVTLASTATNVTIANCIIRRG